MNKRHPDFKRADRQGRQDREEKEYGLSLKASDGISGGY